MAVSTMRIADIRVGKRHRRDLGDIEGARRQHCRHRADQSDHDRRGRTAIGRGEKARCMQTARAGGSRSENHEAWEMKLDANILGKSAARAAHRDR